MKKTLFLLALAVTIAAGCSRYDEELCGTDFGKPACVADVRISLPDMVMFSTRSVDENTVGDIHLFLFGQKSYYRLIGSGGTQVRVEIAEPGTYMAIAITNCDGIHSGMGLTELYALTFDAIGTTGRVVMSGRAEVEVSKGGTTVLEINLERALSKVSFSIRVNDKYNFGIFSVRLCSVPDRGLVVGEGDAMPQAAYADYDETTYDYIKSVDYGGIYLPENLKGRVTSISDPKQKGLDNAPKNSTYLHIRGKYTDRDSVRDYYILLGGNMTDDFNVRRNCHYRYEILLKDSPYAETRVYWYSVALSEKNQWGFGLGSQHSADQDIIGSLSYSDHAVTRYDLKTEVVFDMDNWNEVEFNGQYLSSPTATILPGNYTIRYAPEYFTAGVNDRLAYRVVTTDQFGYSIQKVRNYTCHNKVIVEYNLQDDRYKGSLSYYNESTWFYGPKYTDRDCTNYMQPVSGGGIRLEASGKDGAVFSAWYEEGRGGRVITTNSYWSYFPNNSITRMYAAFASATPDSVKVFTDLRSVSVTCWDGNNGNAVVEHVVDPSLDFFSVPVGTTCQLRYYTYIYWYPTRYSKLSWLKNSNVVTLTPARDVMYWPGL